MQDKETRERPQLSKEQHKVLTLIYELYYKQMYQKAYAILRNKQDAEDAVQEAFYRVCLNAEAFAQPHSDSTVALIHTYTKNAAINSYHRKKRRRAMLSDDRDADELSIPLDDLAALIEREEMAARVRAAVETLEPRYREVITLKYYAHMKNIEISKRLGLSPNVINGRIFRAKKALRRVLDQSDR
ncbi:MAG: RNA polymerase sigma factor [Clostridia bacterium]|nr:RNA polymerase sigma factor [Clostridia bacterium]